MDHTNTFGRTSIDQSRRQSSSGILIPDGGQKEKSDDSSDPVFVGGSAESCPDCGRSLEYQTRVSVLCVGCTTEFEHWIYADEHRLFGTENPEEPAIVARADRPDPDDRELIPDGGEAEAVDVERRYCPKCGNGPHEVREDEIECQACGKTQIRMQVNEKTALSGRRSG